MTAQWKKGDHFRLRPIEGKVVGGSPASLNVEIDGNSVILWSRDMDVIAERIEPPYVPQVGDIVERRGFFHRIEAVGDGTATTDDGTVLISELTLIARKGEVYR